MKARTHNPNPFLGEKHIYAHMHVQRAHRYIHTSPGGRQVRGAEDKVEKVGGWAEVGEESKAGRRGRETTGVLKLSEGHLWEIVCVCGCERVSRRERIEKGHKSC